MQLYRVRIEEFRAGAEKICLGHFSCDSESNLSNPPSLRMAPCLAFCPYTVSVRDVSLGSQAGSIARFVRCCDMMKFWGCFPG